MSIVTQRVPVVHACPWNRANPALIGVPGTAFGLMTRAGVVCLLLLAGCQSNTQTETAVSLEQPKVSTGIIVEPNDATKLGELAAAVDAIELSTPREAPASPEADQDDPNQNPAADQGEASPPRVGMAEAMDMTSRRPIPPESTKAVALPKLSRTELNEIINQVVLGFQSTLGYVVAPSPIGEALPIPPAGLLGERIVMRSGDQGTHVLRFGYCCFVSQPPQLLALGVIVGQDGALSVNPDLAQVEPKVTQIITSLNETYAALTVRDLEIKLVQLSYVDAATAVNMLKGFGVTTLNTPAEVPPKVEFAKLPYVVNIEDPKKEYTGLVGSKEVSSKGKLSMAPGGASELMDNAIASPMTQIMVLFHPAYPEQFSEVRRILDSYVDRPARQIFIEAMVLEISEEGLKDLGVEWELNESPLSITAGSLNAGSPTDTLNISTPDTSLLNEIFEGSEFQWDWEATIRALIRTSKAEILSRPSILTLDNRQSTIRVGEDIPIASSFEGTATYSNKVAFAFEYLPTGILLNIRPRIAESGAEISMLIDTIVSARVPGKDLELRSTDGDVILASAPTISTRRVQTYGRIPNNTPLIIGGLVAREDTMVRDRVPLLGDIPVLGALFRAERKEHLKREVIIVLTPHVLPEKREVQRSLPKDEDLFDSFGNELFRDSYRIRSEDVFDLTFLLENKRIVTYRELARQVAQKNFRLGETEPFRPFVRDSVPGEPILVSRMIYEVIKRLDVASKVGTPHIIYFEGQDVGGYTVRFLERLLADHMENGVTDLGDQALAITYRYDRASLAEGHLGTEPIPEIRLVDCPDREAWGKLLWELNQPLPDGQQRHTILIQNDSDIVRLRRALVLKRIAVLNGGIEEMRLRNFSVGKVLLMPELKKGQIHVLDADTAMFFFHTELYYAATLAEIEKQLKELDKALRHPDIRVLLDSALPGEDTREDGR